MSSNIILTASDKHDFEACLSTPAGTPKGGIVVIQEIFGVNVHIQQVVDRFAAAGYVAIAPALFDRAGLNIKLEYDIDGITKGRSLKDQVDSHSELDVKAAIDYLQAFGPTAVVGFCWGGSLSWRMATDQINNLAAAISYYGGELPSLANRTAVCPFLAHFGVQDTSIPEEVARTFAAAQPGVQTYFYDAGHGFNCNHRGQYDENSAKVAWDRTITFLNDHLV